MLTPRERARQLRRDATPWEIKLWARLRRLKPLGLHFRRQVPIGPYIVDFACYSHRLIVELDGGQHAEDGHAVADARRDDWLKGQGFTVLRFWNNAVGEDADGVADAVVLRAEALRLSHEGEG